MSEDLMQKNVLEVSWRGRRFHVNGLGFWKQLPREKGAYTKHAKWEHPSSMPRGLGRAWKAARGNG